MHTNVNHQPHLLTTFTELRNRITTAIATVDTAMLSNVGSELNYWLTYAVSLKEHILKICSRDINFIYFQFISMYNSWKCNSSLHNYVPKYMLRKPDYSFVITLYIAQYWTYSKTETKNCAKAWSQLKTILFISQICLEYLIVAVYVSKVMSCIS